MIKKSSEQKAILQLMKKSSSQNEQDLCSDFDQYILEKASKHNQSWMQIVPLEGIIKKQLKRGFTKKTIYSYFIDKKLINCTYNTFYNFVSKLEKKDLIKDKTKTISIPKTQQTIQEDTATQIKEVQKPEEQETNLAPKETQTTQTVEPETKEETSFENREFGKLPAGKVWKDLTDDEKDIIRKEREKLRAEETRKRLAENIEANRIAREEAEKNKFNHDPNPKPPGYWETENR